MAPSVHALAVTVPLAAAIFLTYVWYKKKKNSTKDEKCPTDCSLVSEKSDPNIVENYNNYHEEVVKAIKKAARDIHTSSPIPEVSSDSEAEDLEFTFSEKLNGSVVFESSDMLSQINNNNPESSADYQNQKIAMNGDIKSNYKIYEGVEETVAGTRLFGGEQIEIAVKLYEELEEMEKSQFSPQITEEREQKYGVEMSEHVENDANGSKCTAGNLNASAVDVLRNETSVANEITSFTSEMSDRNTSVEMILEKLELDESSENEIVPEDIIEESVPAQQEKLLFKNSEELANESEKPTCSGSEELVSNGLEPSGCEDEKDLADQIKDEPLSVSPDLEEEKNRSDEGLCEDVKNSVIKSEKLSKEAETEKSEELTSAGSEESTPQEPEESISEDSKGSFGDSQAVFKNADKTLSEAKQEIETERTNVDDTTDQTLQIVNSSTDNVNSRKSQNYLNWADEPEFCIHEEQESVKQLTAASSCEEKGIEVRVTKRDKNHLPPKKSARYLHVENDADTRERDSANHSPVGGIFDSRHVNHHFSDVNSEGSSDSGKGCSEGTATPNVNTPAEGNSVIGDNTEMVIFYQFEVPQEHVGKLIGRKGQFVNLIKEQTRARVYIKKHPCPSVDKKVCALEGTQSEIAIALDMIRNRFPEEQYPDLTLEEFLMPLPITYPLSAETCQLPLIEGVNNDVIVSSVISAGHLFVQQPMHPSYASLNALNILMNSVYSSPQAPLVTSPIVDIVVAAPAMGGWYRAHIVSVNEAGDTCEVKFLDYGGYMSLPCSSLRAIRMDFLNLPFQATECILANVIPINGAWCEDAKLTVQSLTYGYMIKAQICGYTESGIPMVLLYAVHPNQVVFVNEELVLRGYATYAVPLPPISDESMVEVKQNQETQLSPIAI